MRFYCVLGMTLLAGGCSCGKDDGGDGGTGDSGPPGTGETELIVDVDADGTIQMTAETLFVEVRMASTREAVATIAPSDTIDEPAVKWPRAVFVPAPRGGERGFVEVTASARIGGTTIASARIQTRFIPRASLRATLLLDGACSGVECPAAQTCSAGSCVDAFVDPATLIVTLPDGGMDDGGPDARSTDSGPSVDGDVPTGCPPHAAVTHLDTGNRHTCALLEGGELWCWGSGEDGRTGTGEMFVVNSPRRIGSMTWIDVTAAARHSCGAATDLSAYCWGFNADGQIGNMSATSVTVPTRVVPPDDPMTGMPMSILFATVTAGAGHSCGIDALGKRWCWGDGAFGQLGLGDTADHDQPAAPPAASEGDWASLAAGSRHTCGIALDGAALSCWGDNAEGQLGLGDSTMRPIPTAVGSFRARRVATGDRHTCAIDEGRTLHCWGANDVGQLGLGDTSARLSPTVVGTDSDWAEVAAGLAHTCAIKLDGSLWCWGEGGEGQLGQGTTTDASAPVRVGTGTSWEKVSVAMGHTCATRRGGLLDCWGRGLEGQLGHGDTLPERTPTEVCF